MSERSKRRCVLRKTALPDATHYVGYVEDEETPEMIMRKFEEMERIRAAHQARQALSEAVQGSQCLVGSTSAAPAADGAGPGSVAQQAPNTTNNAPLNDEQLHAIFKATSMYNVKSVLENNEALMLDAQQHLADRGCTSDTGLDSDSDDGIIDELRGFWSDDDWAYKQAKRQRQKQRTRGNAATAAKPRARTLQRNERTCIVAQYNRGTQAFIRRSMRMVDPDAILQLRTPPPPLPVSWGRAIRLYDQQQWGLQPQRQHQLQHQQQCSQLERSSPAPAAGDAADAAQQSRAAAPRGLIKGPPSLPTSRNCTPEGPAGSPEGCQVYVTPNMTIFPFTSLSVQHYQAVLINTGWELRQQLQQQYLAGSSTALAQPAVHVPSWSSSTCSRGSAVIRLASLPLPSLCPRGFIFIWVDKEHLSAVVRQMSCWGYGYVENLTWVLMHPNHSILRLPYQYLQRSHITLYIFRREGEGRNIELRHQRNPDVLFDCVRAVEGREWDVPADAFDTIETLLPTGKGQFLELWAPKSAGRAGWTHIVEMEV